MKMFVYRFLSVVGLFLFNQTYAEGSLSMPTENKTVVVFETTQGKFEVTLWSDVAPKTVENFLGHVQSGYYKDTGFHRVIKDFMIQGGDPTGTGAGGQSIWGKNFADECSPKVRFDAPGLLAMANRGPNTNGSQFFITTIQTPWLNQKHTIFGQVTAGYDIVQKIESTPTLAQNRPATPQKILNIYVKNS